MGVSTWAVFFMLSFEATACPLKITAGILVEGATGVARACDLVSMAGLLGGGGGG